MHRSCVGRGLRHGKRRHGARVKRERHDHRRRPHDVERVAYPLTASLTGTRTLVYEAAPSSGLGAQSIDLHFVVPDTVAPTLSFDLSLSTPPTPGATGSTSPPCSIPDFVKTGACPQTP